MLSILGINIIIFCILAVCWLVQMLFLWSIFSRFVFSKPDKHQKNLQQPPVSVIICAKNEARFLRKFLPPILEQDYPCFEVVVVNDNSDDDIEFVIKHLSQEYNNLQLVHISTNVENCFGKKFALALGIKAAKYPLLLLTDADCCPKSLDWITYMVAAHQKDHSFVLGYGAYETRKGLLNKLIRFDTLDTAIKYFSMAQIGHPYMGVGRNMMYDKSIFTENYSHLFTKNSISGDDDLLVNIAAKKDNTFCVYNTDAHTLSVQKHTQFWAWIFQKKRHLSASKHYKLFDKSILGLYWLSDFSLYVLLILALFLYILNIKAVVLILSLYVTKSLSQLFLYAKAGKKLNEKHLTPWVPLFDLFFVVLQPLLQFVLLFKKQERWN